MTTDTKTVTPLDDLTSPGLRCPPRVENGRLYWEGSSPEVLIAMFRDGGYDVVEPDDDDPFRPVDMRRHEREVRDRRGRTVAYIVWLERMPELATAYTERL